MVACCLGFSILCIWCLVLLVRQIRHSKDSITTSSVTLTSLSAACAHQALYFVIDPFGWFFSSNMAAFRVPYNIGPSLLFVSFLIVILSWGRTVSKLGMKGTELLLKKGVTVTFFLSAIFVVVITLVVPAVTSIGKKDIFLFAFC